MMNIRAIYEKRSLRNTSNMIGLAFIVSLLMQIVAMIIAYVVIAIIYNIVVPESLSEYYFMLTFMDSIEWQLMLQFFLSILTFTVPFLIVPCGTGTSTAEIVKLKKVSPLLFILLVFMVMGLSAVGNGVSNGLDFLWNSIFGREMQTASFEMPENIFMKIFYVITISIVPALVEEFALRGIVLGSLRRYGNMFAVVTSAFLFGLMHGNIPQFVFAFILGIGLGLCVIVSDSVWPAIAAHFLNNFMSIVLDDIIGPKLTDNEYIMMFIIYMAAVLVIGIVAFIIIIKKYRKPIHEKPDTVLSRGQRTEAFIVSPSMIILLIIYIAQFILLETGVLSY